MWLPPLQEWRETEHEHSECHQSRLVLIGGIQGVRTSPCYNCPQSSLLPERVQVSFAAFKVV